MSATITRCSSCSQGSGVLYPPPSGDLCWPCYQESLANFGAAAEHEIELTGPAAVLRASRVDLIKIIREGIPERAYVPGCKPWLIAGKRYLMPASAGTGKSVVAALIGVTVVEHGGSVVILDVENGDLEYAGRLEDILRDRDEALLEAVGARLRYHAWPQIRIGWNAGEWAEAIERADLVIFDSSRLILSASGLAEDKADDYAKFVDSLLMPLSRSGIATLVLDNTGWADSERARGSKAKEDLNEVVYHLKVAKPFDRDQTGELKMIRGRHRFSGLPEHLSVTLGGGTYRAPTITTGETTSFRPTRVMERASKAIEADPGLSGRAVRSAVGGKAEYVDLALEILVSEDFVRTEPGPRNASKHYVVTPYREALDTASGHGPECGPDAASATASRVPIPKDGTRTRSQRSGDALQPCELIGYENRCGCADGGEGDGARCERCHGARGGAA